MKLEYSGKIFEKYPNIEFHENPSSGSRVLWGRADGEADPDEANSSFIAIWRTRLTTVVFPQSYAEGDVISRVRLFTHRAQNVEIWRCCSYSVNPEVRGEGGVAS